MNEMSQSSGDRGTGRGRGISAPPADPKGVMLEEKLLAHFEEMSKIWGEDGYIEMRMEMAGKTGQSKEDLF